VSDQTGPGAGTGTWTKEQWDEWDLAAADDDFSPEHDDDIDMAGWIAALPADIRAEWTAGPWTGDGEAFAAGFLHHDLDGVRGDGFAAGGPLDLMTAGPMLAQLLAAATDPAGGGHAQLGESELIGVLCGWQRIGAWAAAGQAAAVTTLGRRRAAQARERQNPHLSEHAGDEVAAALVLTGRAAGQLLADAAGLARLPEVHAALADGVIDWRRAVIFAAELASADDHAATQIAGRILARAGRMTTSQIRRALRRAVLDHDPDAAQRRAADAARDADVQAWTEASGNAGLAGRELPEADAISADRRLTALARWLSDRGAAGTPGQLRAAVFTALLAGRPVQSLLPDTMPPTAGPSDLGTDGPAVTGTVHLTMPLASWAGLAGTAGEIAGHGPASPGTCRDLAGQLAASPATRWCLTLTSPDGHPAAHACAPRGHHPPPGRPALHWAAALTSQLAWLESGTCRHTRQQQHYRPSHPLAHLIRIRQPACTFPGCGRPAARSDLDHTIPHHQGGRTCECNLAPTCRQHHRAKQAPGWHLTQDQPGHMTWQLPSGRRYSTIGEPYPV
jgi:hypothetical protein